MYYFTEKNEFQTIVNYIYCPYLFLNPSKINLNLEDLDNSAKYELKYVEEKNIIKCIGAINNELNCKYIITAI